MYSYMRAWPWARALAHLGVGLVLGVWGVCGRAVPSVFFLLLVFSFSVLVFSFWYSVRETVFGI